MTPIPRDRPLRDQPATVPIRVLWLIKGLGAGGAERLLAASAAHRDRTRIEASVAYLLPHKTALVPLVERSGVRVSCLGGRAGWDLRWLVRLRRRLRTEPVDVVHVHSPLAALGARAVLRTLPRRARPRLVTTEHSLWDGHRPLVRWGTALTCGRDDATLTVSDAVQRSLPARVRARSEVVVHGVDTEALRDMAAPDEARAELGVNGSIVIGTVANLRAAKGYEDLLAAARIVLDEEPGVRFVAVGQGPLEHRIRALHTELGLGERFTLLGFRGDAPRVMSAFDVFCLASRHEGLPVALMEALALGLPVVATRVGGVPEIVTDGIEARLVAPARPALLAGALLELVRDPDRRAAMAAAAAARGRTLSVDAAVRRTEAVYAEVLGR